MIHDFKDKYKDLTKSQKRILGYLAYMHRKEDHNFPKQTTIASRKNISAVTFQRAIKRFKEFGWIKVDRPNNWEKNNYTLDQSVVDSYICINSWDKRRYKGEV